MKNVFGKFFAQIGLMCLMIGAFVVTGGNQSFVKADALTYTGFEGFEGTTNLTASYAANSFVGGSGLTFSYNQSRNEDTYGITTKGLMFAGSTSAYLSFSVSNGLSGIKFQYRKAFTGSANRQLNVLINGTLAASTPTFGSGAGAQTTIYDFVYEPVTPFTGVTVVKIAAALANQATIDNIQWAENSSSDVVTALSVTPTTKSYFSSSILQQTDFSVAVTKNGSAGNASDYSAKIGTGTGASFVGSDIVWGTTKPTISQTTIQFKAKYPTEASGSTFLTSDVTLTVTNPSLVSINITGALTYSNYFTSGAWNPAGLVVTATYEDSSTADVTSSVSWSYDPAIPNSVSITSVTITASLSGQTNNISQSVTVTEKTSSVVISEIYGGGGNTNATYTHDFIELFNMTDAKITMTDWALQYASATGAFTTINTFSGSINAKSYFLIRLAAGTTVTDKIDPITPDLTITTNPINLATTNLKIALSNNGTTVTGPISANVVDFVGAGTANQYEGAVTVGPSVTQTISRKIVSGSMVDTDNNANDFELTVNNFSPMNSSLSIAQKIMESGTEGQCTSKFSPMKELVLSLSTEQLAYFKTGAATLMVDARERYLAWATNQHSDPYSTTPLPSNNLTLETSGSSSVLILVLIGLISLTFYLVFTSSRTSNLD